MSYLASSTLAAAVAVFLYILQRGWSGKVLTCQHGCQPPVSYPHIDCFFGLDLKVREVIKAFKFCNIAFSSELFQKYGKTFAVNDFGSITIRTIDPANLKTAYDTSNKDWGYEPIRLAVMGPFCGRGFITTDGDTWKTSRALLRPTFSKTNISDLSYFQASVDSMIRKIPLDCSTIDLQPLLALLFLETSVMFLLGESLDALGAEGKAGNAKDFLKAFHNSMIGMSLSFMAGPFRFLIPKSLKTAAWQKAHAFIESCIDSALHDKRSMQETKNTSFESSPHRAGLSLLEGLAKQTDNRVTIRSQVLQGMMAAQDTTSMLLSNTLFLLARNPNAYERVRKEALSLDLDQSPLLFDSLKQLTFISNVFKESLRMYPIFPVLVRAALNATTLPVGGGEEGKYSVYIPRGTKLVSNYYALHRVQEVFGPDVETFNPDRWLSINPDPWEYMPFSGGPRGCVGQHKALAEASCTLVKIAQTFKRLESRDEKDWAGQMKLTARNVNGCKVALIPA